MTVGVLWSVKWRGLEPWAWWVSLQTMAPRFRNVEKGISLIPLRNLHRYALVLLRANIWKVPPLFKARGEYFNVSQESTARCGPGSGWCLVSEAYRCTMQVYSATTTTVFVTFFEQEYIHHLTLSLWSTTAVLECLYLVGPLTSISKMGVLALLNTTGRSVLKFTSRVSRQEADCVISDSPAAVGIVSECVNVTDALPRTTCMCLGLPLAAVVGPLTLGDIPEESSTWVCSSWGFKSSKIFKTI